MNLKKSVRIGIAKKGGSQNDLANYINKTPQTLSKYLSGDIDPPWSVVNVICEYFGVSMKEFCEWGCDD